jgi:uncharacterized BrkB/YihY/UPF0761 family membrane protein
MLRLTFQTRNTLKSRAILTYKSILALTPRLTVQFFIDGTLLSTRPWTTHTQITPITPPQGYPN